MSPEELTRECDVFTRYLAGRAANTYLLGKYCEYHRQTEQPETTDAFDGFLTRFACRNSLCAKIADCYAARFRRYGSLRRKLTLIVGLMEVSHPYFQTLDQPLARSRILVLTRLAMEAIVHVGAVLIGVVLLSPVHLLYRGASQSGENR